MDCEGPPGCIFISEVPHLMVRPHSPLHNFQLQFRLMASKLQPLSTADESLLCPTCFTQVAHLLSHFKTNYEAFSDQVEERLASFINQKPSDLASH